MATKRLQDARLATAPPSTQRAEDLLAEIQRKKELVAESFIDIGEALLELDRKRLWAALGYASLSKLLAARNVMGRSQAFKLMAVVRALPRRQALLLGPEKAYALVRYASSTHAEERPAEMLSRGIVIAGKRRPVEEVTAREITRQTQKSKTSRARTHADPERSAVLDEADRVVRALARRGVRVSSEVKRVAGELVCDLRIAGKDLARVVV